MKKYALVIGVSSYSDPNITDLHYAASDAEEIGSVLRDSCGFHEVHVLASDGEKEPEHVNILDALENLAPILTAEDMFLFYFAGHGIVADSGAHLLTSNSRIRMPEISSLSWDRLSDYFSRIDCTGRVMILDACRNNPHRAMGDDDNVMTPQFTRDIQAVAETKVGGITPVSCVLYSCSLGERSYEWPQQKHGVFTHYLLKGLRGEAIDERGLITVQGLGRYVEEQVPRWAKKCRAPGSQRPCGRRDGSWRELVLSAQSIAFPKVQTVDEPTPEVHASERDESGRIDWYYVHPEVKKEWVERWGETVTIQLAENDNRTEISPEKVLEGGIVDRIFYDKGKPVLETSISALLLAGEISLLWKLFEGKATENTDVRITNLLLGGKKEKARHEFLKHRVKYKANITGIVIQYIGFSDRGGAEKELQEFTPHYGHEWYKTAKLWKILFDDNDEAKRCLKAGEEKAYRSIAWTYYARGWKELFSDDGETIRCLLKSEDKAKGPSDWLLCAENWKGLFDDDTEAKRCMKKAEGTADTCSDWFQCAENWKELFDDDTEAKRCMKKAEGTVEDSSDWRWCAENWKELFDDDTEAKRCMKKAEGTVEDSSDWRWCAESWKKLFDDDAEAMQCMKKAEGTVEDSSDWRWCAKSWKELFDDDDEAKRCIKTAENEAKNAPDWIRCAEIWKNLGNDTEAKRCMKKAEDAAEGGFHWGWCAESWKELFDDDAEAKHCMKKADGMAKHSYDWRKCAENWKNLGNDTEAKRCMKKAEHMSEGHMYLWELCAQSWKKVFANNAEAERCMREAKKLGA